VPGKITKIQYSMPDIFHTFRKGHRIMVQVQSSWFPLVDRNPQQFEDIYQAKPENFIKAAERIYHSQSAPSFIILNQMK
jgi:predicted acyl esterase